MLQINACGCLFGALLVLLVPTNWLAAASIAAFVHECSHILTIKIFGGRILAIRLKPGGAEILTNLSGQKEELLAAIAGPLGSFLLLSVCHSFPRIAICALIQGIYNLLPVYPLDGGRIALCFAEMFFPRKAQKICEILEKISLVVVFIIVLWAAKKHYISIYTCIVLVILAGILFLRKIPCKQPKIKVQ